MHRILKFVLICILFVFLLNKNANAQKQPAFENIYKGITGLTIDEGQAYQVNNIVLDKEAAKFVLKKGIVVFGQPVNGSVHFALFLGEGSVDYEPVPFYEKDQLVRYCEDSKIHRDIEYLFMAFADSTYENIVKQGTPVKKEDLGSQINIKDANDLMRTNIEYETGDARFIYPAEQFKAFLENDRSGLFYAQFKGDSKQIFCYELNPYKKESIVFNYGKHSSVRKYISNINMFKSRDVKINNAPKMEDFIKIKKYTIHTDIGSNLSFKTKVNILFTSNIPHQRWINFELFKTMEIDSITVNGKKTTNYFKDKDITEMWIGMPEPLDKGKDYNITFYYGGPLLERDQDGWIIVKSYDLWYPKYDVKSKMDFELYFKHPTKYKLCSVGVLIDTSSTGEFTNSHWASIKPEELITFNMGLYKELKVDGKGYPNITVYNYLNDTYGAGSTMNELVGDEVLNCLTFYSTLFGKSDLNNIYITEMPGLYGESYDGLVNLSIAAFYADDTKGMNEIFRAHEIAHQWWGISAGFSTYHDQWLSEAFAEYSALMYLQAKTKDNEKFLDVLSEYKKSILSNRKFILDSGMESGPIYFGYRTSGVETNEDYDLIIYKKGAWVLHMLRMLLIDLKTMNENAFNNMMKDYYQLFAGREAKTEDFKAVVEKHCGTDMTWFFKEWIYDTYIPEIKYAYDVKEDNGKYKVTFKVLAENAKPDFQMYVPVTVKFDDDRFVRLRIAIKGDKTTVNLPPLPLKPDKIIFNEFESMLCTSSEESFSDMKF